MKISKRMGAAIFETSGKNLLANRVCLWQDRLERRGFLIRTLVYAAGIGNRNLPLTTHTLSPN